MARFSFLTVCPERHHILKLIVRSQRFIVIGGGRWAGAVELGGNGINNRFNLLALLVKVLLGGRARVIVQPVQFVLQGGLNRFLVITFKFATKTRLIRKLILYNNNNNKKLDVISFCDTPATRIYHILTSVK